MSVCPVPPRRLPGRSPLPPTVAKRPRRRKQQVRCSARSRLRLTIRRFKVLATCQFDDRRLCHVRVGSSLSENAREQRMRGIVFSFFLFRLRLPVLFFSYST